MPRKEILIFPFSLGITAETGFFLEQKHIYSNKLRYWARFFIPLIILATVITWPGKILAKPELKLSVSLDKEEYKESDNIYITFSIENTGKEAVYVNKRFYLSSDKAPKEQREVFLEVTGPTGAKLECIHSYPTGLPKSDYFELLEPAKTVTPEKRNIRYFFDFKDPGEYKITANYQNVFGGEIGLGVFKEKLISAPVVFKIVKEDANK
ncbi:MAG: hypothetical protein Q8O30_07630 [Candidatus Omnitrophota bacterium]|nr:hypothetical protein [Candidatus Omnitrophota bacterium]